MSKSGETKEKRVLYALVARGEAVLTEYTTPGLTGNFATLTRVLLTKIGSEDSKQSFVNEKYLFHAMVSQKITYLCMTDEAVGRVAPFEFLSLIQQKFFQTFGERAKTAIAYSLNADFQRVLKAQMETFNEKISNQKIDMIQKEINNVKGIMVQNIDKVLARGEKIELLVDKSEQLDQKAFIFKKEATKVKKIMWWNNCKFWLLLFIVLGVIALIIYVIACGGFDCSKK